MTIFNLGSINIDHVYRLARLPAAGETLAAAGYTTGLGGKGANQSVAAALAGATVRHIGAIGRDGAWALDRMRGFGIDVGAVALLGDMATGHAVVMVDDNGENAIVLHAGANRALPPADVERALAAAAGTDTLLLQNETSQQEAAVRLARRRGLRVICSAAPFDVDAVRAVLPFVTILIVNAVEAAQLQAGLGTGLADLPVSATVVTRGAAGADWVAAGGGFSVPALAVQAVDTTGAGDCFAGTLAAGLDAGVSPKQAMRKAAAAAAIQVTRPGASDAMPTAAEVSALLAAGC